jgi:hypothetical protein
VCSGGGLRLDAGGLLRVVNSSLVNNSAGQFGGGLALGVHLGTVSTCELDMLAGTFLAGNTASHGGAQLYSECSGDFKLEGTTMLLGSNQTQVRGGGVGSGEWGG